jgi:hypothetical protein
MINLQMVEKRAVGGPAALEKKEAEVRTWRRRDRGNVPTAILPWRLSPSTGAVDRRRFNPAGGMKRSRPSSSCRLGDMIAFDHRGTWSSKLRHGARHAE